MNKTLWIGIGLLVAVVAIAGYLLYSKRAYSPGPNTSQSASSPSALSQIPTKEVVVSGQDYSFTPSKIEVNREDHVVITFKNMGKSPHNLTISDLNLATNTVSTGGTDKIEFTATQTGTFAFTCTVDGHKDLGMQGSLEVK